MTILQIKSIFFPTLAKGKTIKIIFCNWNKAEIR